MSVSIPLHMTAVSTTGVQQTAGVGVDPRALNMHTQVCPARRRFEGGNQVVSAADLGS